MPSWKCSQVISTPQPGTSSQCKSRYTPSWLRSRKCASQHTENRMQTPTFVVWFVPVSRIMSLNQHVFHPEGRSFYSFYRPPWLPLQCGTGDPHLPFLPFPPAPVLSLAGLGPLDPCVVRFHRRRCWSLASQSWPSNTVTAPRWRLRVTC